MSTPAWFYWKVLPGEEDRAVRIVQLKLGLPVTGILDAATGAVLRGFQHRSGLIPTGTIDEPTAALLGPESTEGLLPLWWGTESESAVISERIGDTDALRRFQSAHRITPTGVVDEATALLIGD